MRRLLQSAALVGVAWASFAIVLAGGDDAENPRLKERPEAMKVEQGGGLAIEKAIVEIMKARNPEIAQIGGFVRQLPENAQIGGFVRQFRPLMRAEYQLIRMACGPSEEQCKQIALGGERALRDAAVLIGRGQRRNVAGQPEFSDPRKLIREKMAGVAKSHLSPEQFARYQTEVEEQVDHHKRVVVLNLVARLDQKLILSAGQRDELAKSLSSHWDDNWHQALLMIQPVGDDSIPDISDRHIVPFLDEVQRKVWADVSKKRGAGAGFISSHRGLMGDDALEDEALEEARKADQAPSPKE